jgi:hypothetical protein
LSATAILLLSRTYTFYFDEWDFIQHAPDWTWASFLQPHNEHPTMLPRFIYAELLYTFGMRTYVPYMLVLAALHATSAVLLFELVRRRAGDLVGIACAAMLLVLGAGWENLLWAFQIAFVGSVASGLGMLLALEGRKLTLAVVLLAVSLMFSGIGVFFGVVAAARLLLDAQRRRELLWFVPVGIALAAWYLAFGRGGAATVPPPNAGNLMLLPAYVGWGLAGSAAGIIGVTGPPTLLVLLVAAAALGFAWWHRRPDSFAVAIAAGLLTFYVVTGLTRAQLGYEQAASGRYVYVGAVFWLLLLADAARRLPWAGTWRPALAALVFLACFNSSVLLVAYAAGKAAVMQREIADLQALAVERSDRCLSPSGAADPLVMPYITNPALYYRAVDRYGDPTDGLPITDRTDFDRARANLTRSDCTPTYT